MKRQPSIHISKGDLLKVLKKLLSEDYSLEQLKVLRTRIMREGVKYALTKRSINVTNQKLLKSTKGIMNTETEDTKLFAHLLTLCRRKLQHRAVIQPAPGSKDWTLIQSIIPNVNSFCDDFNLAYKREGYRIYIELGLKKMNKFYLTNFPNLHDAIANEYAAVEELGKDMTPLRTEKAHDIYSKHCGELAMVVDFRRDPAKMVCFKRVAEKAQQLRVSIENYIAAQFEGLKWAKTIPDPHQLVTDAALTRLNKYIVKANLKEGMQDEEADDVADKIKQQWSKLSSGTTKRK